jgi:hypothetical protein
LKSYFPAYFTTCQMKLAKVQVELDRNIEERIESNELKVSLLIQLIASFLTNNFLQF